MHLHLDALTFEEKLHLLETLAVNTGERERVEAFGRWLFAETGGQPLYVTETLKTLIERGFLARIPHSDGLWRVDFLSSSFNEAALRRFLPPCVREVIRVRLNQLAPDSFALLVAGAVLGRDASFEELCQVVNGKSDLFVMVFGLSRWYITEALVRAGHIPRAIEDLERWQVRIEESPRHRIPYLHAVAVLAHAQGQTGRAIAALKEALANAQTLHLAGEQKAIEAVLQAG